MCVRLRKRGRKVCVNMCLREREREMCVLVNVSWPRQQVKVASRPGIIQSTHTWRMSFWRGERERVSLCALESPLLLFPSETSPTIKAWKFLGYPTSLKCRWSLKQGKEPDNNFSVVWTECVVFELEQKQWFWYDMMEWYIFISSLKAADCDQLPKSSFITRKPLVGLCHHSEIVNKPIDGLKVITLNCSLRGQFTLRTIHCSARVEENAIFPWEFNDQELLQYFFFALSTCQTNELLTLTVIAKFRCM